MERQIRDRHTPAILREAAHRYRIGEHGLRPLAASESFVYAFRRGPHGFVLRLGHSLRRSEALVRGELDWLRHLAAAGVPVAAPVASAAGDLVETIDDGRGGAFLATAFVEARGRPLDALESPELARAFGRLLGSMHARAQRYRPARAAWRRPAWDDDVMDYVERYLPASERVAKATYRALCDHLRTLPTDDRSYGLIHFDAHGGNCRVDDGGRITIFDFDDCTYSWYVNDIAIALGYVAMGAPDAPARTRRFLPRFLEGYRTAFPLEARWLREIPVFLKMAEIFMYAVLHRDAESAHAPDPGLERAMRESKDRIENDVLPIDVDFASFAARP